MKTLYKNILVAIALCSMLVIGTTSCEDMIKEKKFDFIMPGDIEDSDDGASQWVIGTYSRLTDDMFRWSVFPQVLEYDCDYMTGPDWAFGSLGAGNFQQSEHAEWMWNKPYNLIHRANFALESIEPMVNTTEAHKNNAIGELKFLKAYGYFLLVRAFGEIPLRYKSIYAGDEIHTPRQPLDKVYAHIIELLTDAEKLMYKNTDARFVAGRASAGAAATLLAKVYVTIGSASLASGEVIVQGGKPFEMNGTEKIYTNPSAQKVQKTQVKGYSVFDSKKYFELARDKAKEVMDGKHGSYKLIDNYENLWAPAYKNKEEHIWSLQTISGDEKHGTQVSQGYTGIENDKGYVITGLWYGCRDHWYKLFESKDDRVLKGVIHRWVREGADSSWGGGSFYPNTEEWQKKATGYTDENGNTVAPVAPFNDGYSYRYSQSSSFLAYLTKYSFVSNRQESRSDANWPFLRYADLLLIYAEASNEASGLPTTEGLAALNQVRERSHATPRTLSGNGSINTLTNFRSAVIEERAMELALEGDRRWDLIRWGIYLPVMNAIGGIDEVNVVKTRTEKHLLYPIPASELDTNKEISENNFGWN